MRADQLALGQYAITEDGSVVQVTKTNRTDGRVELYNVHLRHPHDKYARIWTFPGDADLTPVDPPSGQDSPLSAQRIRIRLSAGPHGGWGEFHRQRGGSWVSTNGHRRFGDDAEFWRFVGDREVKAL